MNTPAITTAAAYRAGQLAEHLHAHRVLVAVLIPATVLTATITRLRTRRGVSCPGCTRR